MASYSEILDRIYNLRGGIIDLRLDRMYRALALFDHPQNAYPSIHIAGTNGKGSTAAMLHRVLSDAGYRTALYTSPHLTSFTERIRVDNQEIAQNDVLLIAEQIWQQSEAAGVPLTFFEFVTLMAFVYFARHHVDIAVIEVGLGGRLDATNVVKPLVAAITTISKDHEAYLGPDEISIAREKGGIIKPGMPLVCGKLSDEILDVVGGIARERGSPVYSLGRNFSFSLKDGGLFDYTGIKHHFLNVELALAGRHQRANAAVALAVLELVQGRFPVDEATIRAGLRRVRWPGRLEVITQGRATVILDGAHNPEGIRALVDELQELRGGRKVKLLFAAMADKEWELMLRVLAEAVDEIVFTKVDMERSADPELLAAKNQRIAHRVIGDSRRALQTLLAEATEDDVVVVAGSLYLIGEVRPILQEGVVPAGTLEDPQ
jgi:dihydrofolate synthase/folylpolyglutamate synthase